MSGKILTGRRMALAAGLAVMLGGFGYALYGGIDEGIVYFLTPQELLAKGTDVYGTPVRLGGQVVPGTVQWNAEKLDLRFKIGDGAKEVLVHSSGAPPQMFRDGMGVIVEGRYGKDGVFESKNLMVKHSNEYKAPPPGHKPADVYKTLVKEQGT